MKERNSTHNLIASPTANIREEENAMKMIHTYNISHVSVWEYF